MSTKLTLCSKAQRLAPTAWVPDKRSADEPVSKSLHVSEGKHILLPAVLPQTLASKICGRSSGLGATTNSAQESLDVRETAPRLLPPEAP
jgi:hypothetical protein